MNKEELETYIKLKFYPLQPTIEYAESIPLDVKEEVFIFTSGYDSIDEAATTYIEIYQGLEKTGGFIKDELWEVLKKELLKYYSKNSDNE